MSSSLRVLLKRYFVSYWRTPKRLFNDILLMLTTWIFFSFTLFDPPHIQSLFVYYPALVSGSLMVIPFSSSVTVFLTLTDIVVEKSSGMKEFYKLNGVSVFIYQCYIIIITLIKTTVFVLIMMLIIFIQYHVNVKLTFEVSVLYYVLLSLISVFGTMNFVLVSSLFCSNPRTSSIIVGFFWFVLSIVITLDYTTYEMIPNVVAYFAFLSPLAFMGQQMFMDQISALGYSEIIVTFAVLLFELVLYLYVDQIIDNKNKVRRFFSFFSSFPDNRGNCSLTEILVGNKENRDRIIVDQQTKFTSASCEEPINLEKIAQVTNVSKRYGKFLAVNNVSFPLYKNNIFCLLGENGAGKTTVIKMMLGQIEIDKGNIFYEDRNLVDHLKEMRANIGFCAEQGIFFERHSVAEHLEVIAKLRQIPEDQIKQEVEQTMRKLELIGERDKYVEELSGGSRRKLSLAMAVLGKIKVLFLDEPTSGVDPQNRRTIWQLLKKLKEDFTILMTTHHLEEAEELSDQIGIMSKGELYAYGTSDFLKKSFCDGYNYLELTPKPDQEKIEEDHLNRMISQVVIGKVVERKPIGDGFRLNIQSISQENLLELARQFENLEQVNLSYGMNTLEDVLIGHIMKKNMSSSERVTLNVDDSRLSDDIPECFHDRPSYSFMSQMKALAKRRMYLLYRSKLNLLFILVPNLFSQVAQIWAINNLNNVFFFFPCVGSGLIGYCFTVTTYCLFVVYERQENLKYLMYAMGLRRNAYWIANFLVDFLWIALINSLTFCGIWLYFHFSYGKSDFFSLDFLLVLISHGTTLITLGYAWSFLFTRTSSVIKYFPLSYLFLLLLLLFVGEGRIFERLSSGFSSEFTVFTVLAGFLCPTAVFTYFMAFLDLPFVFIGKSTEFAFWQFGYAIIYFILTLLIEIIIHQYAEIKLKRISVLQQQEEQQTGDSIKALNLTKRYKPNDPEAIKNINLNVKDGQVFSVIGPNGAGKSTLFNIFTASISKSEGSAKLVHQEITNYLPKVFENVGVCPQSDGLWEDLTVKEHLTIFGTLKGLNKSNLPKAMEYYLDSLSLTEYVDKKAFELSKGNKRKLSVANAFIGLPRILFLDEPSTGLDPFARISLRKSIQQILKINAQASIFLSTHSIYEAQSLSHKIGIIARGELTFPVEDQGYNIVVVPTGENFDISTMKQLFPDVEIMNSNSSRKKLFYVPISQDIKFSDVFCKLEKLQEEGVVKAFSIHKDTFEHTFSELTKPPNDRDNN